MLVVTARFDRRESVGGVETAGLTRIMAAVLGLLLRQVEDMTDACPRSGRSVEFRKAPLVNFLGRLCLQFAGSGGIWSCPRFSVKEAAVRSFLSVAIMDEVRRGECHESQDWRTRNGDLSLGGDEELAWSFGTRRSGLEVGASTQVKLIVLPFRVKIQVLALIGCA